MKVILNDHEKMYEPVNIEDVSLTRIPVMFPTNFDHISKPHLTQLWITDTWTTLLSRRRS